MKVFTVIIKQNPDVLYNWRNTRFFISVFEAKMKMAASFICAAASGPTTWAGMARQREEKTKTATKDARNLSLYL